MRKNLQKKRVKCQREENVTGNDEDFAQTDEEESSDEEEPAEVENIFPITQGKLKR